MIPDIVINKISWYIWRHKMNECNKSYKIGTGIDIINFCDEYIIFTLQCRFNEKNLITHRNE